MINYIFNIILLVFLYTINGYQNILATTNLKNLNLINQPNYNICKGKAIDELNSKYTNLFLKKPDFSIYSPIITFSEFNDYKLHGLNNYKYLFEIFHTFNYLSITDHHVSHSIYVENDRIKIRWKLIFNFRNQFECYLIEGISYYYFNDQGLIDYHKIDNIVINNQDLYYNVILDLFKNKNNIHEPVFSFGKKKKINSYFKLVDYPKRISSIKLCNLETPIERAKRERDEDRLKREKIPSKIDLFHNDKYSFGKVCYSSLDCERPFKCCNLLITSICCIDGGIIPVYKEPTVKPQMIPIPITDDYQ